MIIPIEELSQEVLYNLVESFVLREGTDYGETEVSTEQKVAEVIQQLRDRSVVLLYSELHETINIVTQEAFNAMADEEPHEQ